MHFLHEGPLIHNRTFNCLSFVGGRNNLENKEYLCYIYYMNTTIRNLDKEAYRALKARAAITGKTIGKVLNEAIQSYLARPETISKGRGSLSNLTPEKYPKGNEHLSEEIDAIVYGR